MARCSPGGPTLCGTDHFLTPGDTLSARFGERNLLLAGDYPGKVGSGKPLFWIGNECPLVTFA